MSDFGSQGGVGKDNCQPAIDGGEPDAVSRPDVPASPNFEQAEAKKTVGSGANPNTPK